MSRPSILAPEVVQSSAMDCGPASLDSLLSGFGINVNYGRLREACQTDVDGTSIDTLEDVAVALGLDAEQIVTPVDHLLLAEADSLPGIAVVRLPNGVTHFVVVWRTHGPWVQIMDPGSGRVWLRKRKFLDQLYVHSMPVAAEDWRDWAGSEDFVRPLRARLAAIGCSGAAIDRFVEAGLADGGHQTLASLDAALRMVTEIVETGGLRRGAEAEQTTIRLQSQAMEADDPSEWIPSRYWSAAPVSAEDRAAGRVDEDSEDQAQVMLRGAVMIQAIGVRDPNAVPADGEAEDEAPAPIELPPDLASARDQDTPRPARLLFDTMLADGWLTPGLVVVSLLAAALGTLFEAAILRGLVELGVALGLVSERLVAWVVVVVFAGVLLLVEGVIAGELLGIGRRLEARLRVAFLAKVPRLGARYFQSRLSSDMAERIHAMHGLRRLPHLGADLIRTVASLLLTVAGIAWLDPGGALVGSIATVLLLVTTFVALPTLSERDLRFRTHGGALSRVYLDALLGLVPIRTHGAARSVRREHEQLLVEWMRAGLDMIRTGVTVSTIQGIVGFAVVIVITMRHSLGSGEIGAMLLLIYWSLMLPTLGQRVGDLVRQYPGHRSRALRLLEPIGAPDEDAGADPEAAARAAARASSSEARGVALSYGRVAVRAGGHVLLRNINLEIAAGEHLAIVGPSGAGKSTLVSLLLGWHRTALGELRVDGETLDGAGLARLRRHTAWVDPAVALWNQPLIDNLLYGSPESALARVGAGMAEADLLGLVANLPDGLQTELGEGGALLSGGEGQRVRLGRALLRPDVRLIILDEPLRGLDRERRRVLMRRIRAWWPDATLLCVTHDLEETREFPRVVVIEDGTIVEDASPDVLLADPETRYATMLAHERAVHRQLWGREDWRRISIHGGKVHEAAYEVGGLASSEAEGSS